MAQAQAQGKGHGQDSGSAATLDPVSAAKAKLAAQLAQGASSSAAGVTVPLAKLPRGTPFDLRGAAKAIGYQLPTKANGKANKAPLRTALARLVAQGQLVVAKQGGYANAAGTTSCGHNWYYVVE